jgi:hypothetical protein
MDLEGARHAAADLPPINNSAGMLFTAVLRISRMFHAARVKMVVLMSLVFPGAPLHTSDNE